MNIVSAPKEKKGAHHEENSIRDAYKMNEKISSIMVPCSKFSVLGSWKKLTLTMTQPDLPEVTRN